MSVHTYLCMRRLVVQQVDPGSVPRGEFVYPGTLVAMVVVSDTMVAMVNLSWHLCCYGGPIAIAQLLWWNYLHSSVAMVELSQLVGGD